MVKNFLCFDNESKLEDALLRIHQQWCKENSEFYQKQAINSAFLTSCKNSSADDRKCLFEFIGSKELRAELFKVFPKGNACFLNTQLFFNPVNPSQKNYWHRDIQYTDLSLEEQKQIVEFSVNNVVHFRIAIRDDPGLELIPGSNKRWDSDLEYNVRNELNGKSSSDELPGGIPISLNRGDLLVFSANMIHRGLYGKDRLALDILFCEPDPKILKFVDPDCYPKRGDLNSIENTSVFTCFLDSQS